MGIYIIKRKTFSKYDDTDNLKRMKDSDILAEKPKTPETTTSHLAAATLGGGLVGGALGAAGKFVAKSSKGARFAKAGKGGKFGALVGAGIGLAAMASKRSQEKANNEFYNDRLRYAQRQAQRRERRDWKANMTQRDGYSY